MCKSSKLNELVTLFTYIILLSKFELVENYKWNDETSFINRISSHFY